MHDEYSRENLLNLLPLVQLIDEHQRVVNVSVFTLDVNRERMVREILSHETAPVAVKNKLPR